MGGRFHPLCYQRFHTRSAMLSHILGDFRGELHNVLCYQVLEGKGN